MNKISLDIFNGLNKLSGAEAGLVRTLARFDGGRDPAILLAAALTSRAASEGHVCIDLSRLAQQPIAGIDTPDLPAVCPSLEAWLSRLQASPLVGRPGQWRPLILDRRHFLYLQRYHVYEQAVAELILSRGQATAALPGKADLAEKLARYFPDTHPGDTDWQRIAAIIAVMRRLCVISGAPGTGKTTTAARIIGLLIEIHHPQPLRFALCAPTGKAAARLSETLSAAAETLPSGFEAPTRLPMEASTIHRLLGYGRKGFRFHANHQLPVDVVVMDEASMVDLVLMAQLLEAIPPAARLIILGDRDQLSSVEAGAVMGDICQGVVPMMMDTELQEACRRLSPAAMPAAPPPPSAPSALSDNVIILDRNYRFDAGQGIGALVRAVNASDPQAVCDLLHDPPPGIQWLRPPLGKAERRRLEAFIVEGYRPLFEAATVDDALGHLDRFMVLCALTGGPWGRARLNAWIESRLRQAGRITDPHPWYRGRPVMIRRNDYRSGLFNGDVGITWMDGDQRPSERRIWFRMPTGQVRAFTPAQLPEHQTALALTVHKSQGSEYRRVVLVLPAKDSPILTRELLYTGLSRARQGVLLVAGQEVIDLAVNRRIQRASGLQTALKRKSPCTSKAGTQGDTNGENEK
ncbi:MAG: exodeoxyribonuclease V subunit alpha [Desulfobacterales bacterium]|jgi:exodeoxyribonuclease V alpha subunit